MKNILVITGSPRKKGNSNMLAEAFSEGASAKGHLVTTFAAADKKIGGCKACDMCWSKGTACVFDDDFSELALLVEKSDVIVFATPLYWFSFSAQIKSAMDRLYSFDSPNRPPMLKVKEKETVLLTCAGADDVFDGMIKSYEYCINYMNWLDKGILAIPNVLNKGDILNTDGLAKAKLLGESI